MAIVREMMQQDLEEVSLLETAIFTMPWSKAGFEASLSMENSIFLVAEEEGRILGYCGMVLSIEEGEITNVAVAPDARCRGIGDALLREMIRRGKEQGCEKIVLEVRVSNETAIRLYQKHQFVSVGVRKGFYEKPKEDAYIMIYGQ